MNIGAGIGIGFAEPRGVLAFEYEQSSGCQNGSDITPVINTPGGTFSASPAGLSIDEFTGVIDVSASPAGTYTVTYSIGPTEDTITIQAADDATFSYSASSFPQDGSNPTPTVTLTGGTFSAGSGLVFVDSGSNTGSSTGQIDLSASTIASYTITYTTAGSCPNSSTQTVEVASAVAISYSSSEFCEDASNPTPTVTGNVGAGTFSSTTGLVFVSTLTGEVDLSTSTPSATPYVITYTDTNSATATFNLTLNALDDAGFSYSESSFPQNFPDPTPTITGLADGTFSGTTGLVINSTTGVIDLDASTIASHTVTYDTTSSGSSVCPNTSTQTINIVAELAQVGNVYSMDFDRIALDEVILRTSSTPYTFTGSGSVSLWFKTSSSFGTSNSSIGNLTGGRGLFEYLCIRSNKLVNFVLGSGFGYTELTTVAVNDGDWHHLVLSYDSTTAGGPLRGTFKAYFDGQLTKTLDMDGSTEDWGTSTLKSIGSYGQSSVGRYFDGLIDEVAAWDVDLTAQEVKSIYLATGIVSGVSKTADLNDLTTPPVKWYRMGD